jgi:hypothetical protein
MLNSDIANLASSRAAGEKAQKNRDIFDGNQRVSVHVNRKLSHYACQGTLQSEKFPEFIVLARLHGQFLALTQVTHCDNLLIGVVRRSLHPTSRFLTLQICDHWLQH